MDGRTLVLGDWNPVVRDPIDILRASFAVGAVALAVLGESGALNLAFGAALVFAVRPLHLPRLYDLSFVLAMGLIFWGEALRAYDVFPAYDLVTHALVPLLGAPILYIALARLEVLPDPAADTKGPHYVGIFTVTLALGLALGAVWEIVEYGSDRLLATNLSLGQSDTIGDLVADSLGALAGAALLVVWAIFGWGSVRRIPGESRREQRQA